MARSKIMVYRNYLIALAILSCFAFVLPIGRDWPAWNVSSTAQITGVYDKPFTGAPYAYFALPHVLLDISIGNAINLALNILVIAAVAYRYAGKQWHIAFAIAMTSPMAINLIMSNNIDWIPLSAFLVADWAAYPLLAMKPQVLGMAAIIRFKRNPYLLPLIPLIVLVIASIAIWGAWWQHLGGGLFNVAWNFAPFPYMIPVGLYLIWIAWKREDEIIAACATPFLVPYFAPYSLAGLHVLLASRYRKAAIILWCFSWWFLIITARRTG